MLILKKTTGFFELQVRSFAKMKLDTLKFGVVEVDDSLLFNFLEPVLGYEHLKQFVLIDYDTDSPFKWLQSVEDMNVSFPVTIPALFGINYTFTVPEYLIKLIELDSIQDVLTLNIVNIPKGKPEDSTVNLLAPIVINISNKSAIQMVLQDGDYPVRQKLFKEGI